MSLNFIATTCAVVFIIIVLFVGSLYLQQRRFIYYPDTARTAPDMLGLRDVRELMLETPDGETLIAWYGAPSPDRPTILYFHGNGGALKNRKDRIELMQRWGYGVMMLSYRGYGGSTGSPTEKNILSDAELSYNWLRNNGVKQDDVILYGESLGTGVAVQLAAQRKTAAVILEAPYTSLPDIARLVYPFLPTRILMIDHFDSTLHIQNINAPLLVLHGERDGVIPAAFGKKLYELAHDPKELMLFSEGSHSDLYAVGAWEKITDFISKTQSR